MRNTSFSPLCAAFLLLMLLSPLAASCAVFFRRSS